MEFPIKLSRFARINQKSKTGTVEYKSLLTGENKRNLKAWSQRTTSVWEGEFHHFEIFTPNLHSIFPESFTKLRHGEKIKQDHKKYGKKKSEMIT